MKLAGLKKRLLEVRLDEGDDDLHGIEVLSVVDVFGDQFGDLIFPSR